MQVNEAMLVVRNGAWFGTGPVTPVSCACRFIRCKAACKVHKHALSYDAHSHTIIVFHYNYLGTPREFVKAFYNFHAC